MKSNEEFVSTGDRFGFNCHYQVRKSTIIDSISINDNSQLHEHNLHLQILLWGVGVPTCRAETIY